MVLRGDEITPIIRVSQRSCQTNDVPSAFAMLEALLVTGHAELLCAAFSGHRRWLA